MKKLYLFFILLFILSSCWLQKNINNDVEKNVESSLKIEKDSESNQEILDKTLDIKSISECNTISSKKEDIWLCINEFIRMNSTRLDKKVCNEITDDEEKLNCINFFGSK